MNKLKFLYLSAFATCLVGCQDDLEDQEKHDPEYAPVHFNLSFGKLGGVPDTRSLAPGYQYADGSSISELKCYVYDKSRGNSAAPVSIVDIDIKEVNANKGGDVTVLLPKGEAYDVVFLGTSIPQTTASSKLYYNTTNRTLNINYSVISCNDEEIDCFYASRENVTTETAFNQTIELTRPFAQINVGTQDYSTYTSTSPIKNIAMSVNGVFSSVNLMSGELVGNATKANFTASAVPTGQTFPIAGYSYLSMCYVLVNQRKLVDVSLTVNHTSSSTAAMTIEIPGVAVERNYQTNIYGKNLLTEDIIL